MPLTSSSKPFLRIGSYEYPTTDMYAQETPFGSLGGATFAPVSMGTRHGWAAYPHADWQLLHVDAGGGGGGGTSAYPIGG